MSDPKKTPPKETPRELDENDLAQVGGGQGTPPQPATEKDIKKHAPPRVL